jgi:hypothetical protein
VADRVAYDTVAYFTQRNNMPPQDANTVFRTRTGVCAGYAQLLAAMGLAAGEEIVVVVGDARTESSDLTGEGHAWNAAQIDGAWYLIDPTWDSGHIEGQEFVKAYTTSNLFTPPTVFSVTHFPDETRWQLHDPPIERGDFFRQPVMRPEFFATGLELISPTPLAGRRRGRLRRQAQAPRGPLPARPLQDRRRRRGPLHRHLRRRPPPSTARSPAPAPTRSTCSAARSRSAPTTSSASSKSTAPAS